jgi:DNA-binding GntR family transcriptional regulator
MQAVLGRDHSRAIELMHAHLSATEQSVAEGLRARASSTSNRQGAS